MRNDVSIPPDEPTADPTTVQHEVDPLPREAVTAHREARITDTHLVNPAERTRLTHPELDPKIESAARRGDKPDVGIYDTPSTMRESGSDITMSIVILVLALAAALAIFLMWFRK